MLRDGLHIERAGTAFEKSFNAILQQIEQGIDEAAKQGRFSFRIDLDEELPYSVIETIKDMLKSGNYDCIDGCRSENYKIYKFITISWATNEGRIKKDDD